jgi:rRNA pseudouridine-1189 N-methylase Emg1 (Nep1/Mra1 family)
MEEGYVLNLKSDRRMARKNIFISCLPNYQTNMGVHLKNEKEKHTNIIFVFIIQVIESVVSNAKVKNIYVITLSQNVQPPVCITPL